MAPRTRQPPGKPGSASGKWIAPLIFGSLTVIGAISSAEVAAVLQSLFLSTTHVIAVFAGLKCILRLYADRRKPPRRRPKFAVMVAEALAAFALTATVAAARDAGPVFRSRSVALVTVAWYAVQLLAAKQTEPPMLDRLLETRVGTAIDLLVEGSDNALLRPLRHIWTRSIDRGKHSVTALTSAIALATLLGGATQPLMTGVLARRSQETRETTTTIEQLTPAPTAPPTASPSPSPEPTYEDLCGTSVYPGDRAPEWARVRLRDLYFKSGSGAGAGIAGCPRPSVEIRSTFDHVVYQLGFDRTGALKSVAIVAARRGDALVLSDAAAYARGRLEAGIVTTATPRRDAGPGDVYLLHDSGGTTAFIRAEKVYGGPNAHYTRVPPAAGRAWLAAMSMTGRWLWPMQTNGSLSLKSHPEHDTVARITMLGATSARLVLGSREMRFSPTSYGVSDLSERGLP